MITLAPTNVTTINYLYGSTVVGADVTDTLFVQDVRLDFSTGAMYATIQRGTVTNGVFGENYPSVTVTVNPDGSFISSDGKWAGNLGSAATGLIAQLKTTFDQFILAAGLVQGTIVVQTQTT